MGEKRGRVAFMALVLLLCAGGCTRMVKRPGRDVSGLFFSALSPHMGFKGVVVFNGEIECSDGPVPFVLGTSFGPDSTEMIFYSPAGEKIFSIEQRAQGEKYSTPGTGAESDKSGRRILKWLEDIPDRIYLGAILSGKIPFEGMDGDLFQVGGGYLYEGEGFTVRSDEKMRILKAEYDFDGFDTSVTYDYRDGRAHLPTSVWMALSGCRVRMLVEKNYGELR